MSSEAAAAAAALPAAAACSRGGQWWRREGGRRRRRRGARAGSGAAGAAPSAEDCAAAAKLAALLAEACFRKLKDIMILMIQTRSGHAWPLKGAGTKRPLHQWQSNTSMIRASAGAASGADVQYCRQNQAILNKMVESCMVFYL